MELQVPTQQLYQLSEVLAKAGVLTELAEHAREVAEEDHEHPSISVLDDELDELQQVCDSVHDLRFIADEIGRHKL